MFVRQLRGCNYKTALVSILSVLGFLELLNCYKERWSRKISSEKLSSKSHVDLNKSNTLSSNISSTSHVEEIIGSQAKSSHNILLLAYAR